MGEAALELLAIMLIVAPVQVPLPSTSTPALQTALQRASVRLELYDPQKTAWAMNLAFEVKDLRRALNASWGCPPSSDLERFPSAEQCLLCIRFAAHYRGELQQQHDLITDNRSPQWDALLRSIDQRAACWVELLGAHDTWHPYLRRQSLRDLRTQLGPDLYYAGALPMPVPLWTFQTIK